MTEPKKKILNVLFTAVFMCCFIILLTVISFSWLPRQNKQAYRAYYGKDLIITSLNLDIEFQVYNNDPINPAYLTIAKYVNGELQPLEENQPAAVNYGVKFIRLNPGDKQPYRFKITNLSSTADVTCGVELHGFFQKPPTSSSGSQTTTVTTTVAPSTETLTNDIFEQLTIYVTSPETRDLSSLRSFMKENGTGENKSLDLDFYDNLTIEKSETIYLDWYIELSTEADNAFQGYSFGFDSIFFSA